jgi:hypothetical protein
VKGWTTVEGDLTVTATGLASQTVTYTNVMAGTFETKTVSFAGGTANSTVTIATTAKRVFLDDLVITAAAPAAPAVSASGNLSVLNATYGSASLTATSFSVSGENLTQGILVDPPDGFEVSLASDGASGYAATQTVAGTGTIAPTTVFIRLAAGSAAGFYSGNLVCSSGAASATLAVPEAEVRKKGLSITANDRSKAFGQTLTLGSGQTGFAATGLVGSQSVGTVTLTASGGTAANDAAGTYVLMPSAATGGTFSEANYNINYLPGVLTVVGQSYADWAAGRTNSAPNLDPDGNGLSNLMEYFMGINDGNPLAGPAMVLTNSESGMSMTFRRFKGLAGVNGSVEHVTDLGAPAWDTNGVTVKKVVDRGTYEEVTVEVAPAPGSTKMFMRLRVTTP